ncbi:MAG: Uma2 family endonuclease [Thermomicrobiales bacterium]
MSRYARLLDLGTVLIAPFEMRLAPVRPSREPDIAFVSRDHSDRITVDRLNGPADLVIDVISPDSVTRDRRDKFHEYAKAGVREYWTIDSRTSRRDVHASALTDEGVYEPIQPDADGQVHSTVLSGFWLDSDWLQTDPLPDPDAILMEIAADRLFEKFRALYESRRRSSEPR